MISPVGKQGGAADACAAGAWDYVVASSLSHDRFSDSLSPYHDEETAGFYRQLFGYLRLRAAFPPAFAR